MESNTTYTVLYSGGESRTEAHRACDFMLVTLNDGDELYAERVYPEDVEGDSAEYAELENQFYNELKAEITEQAEAHGISANHLRF